MDSCFAGLGLPSEADEAEVISVFRIRASKGLVDETEKSMVLLSILNTDRQALLPFPVE